MRMFGNQFNIKDTNYNLRIYAENPLVFIRFADLEKMASFVVLYVSGSPEVNVTADISVDIHEDVLYDDLAPTKLQYTPKFICSVLNPGENYTYDVRFFINDIEIRAAEEKNVTFDNLHSVHLLQRHWEKLHKPNMFVSFYNSSFYFLIYTA